MLLLWIAVTVAASALISALITLTIGRLVTWRSRSAAGVELAAEYRLID